MKRKDYAKYKLYKWYPVSDDVCFEKKGLEIIFKDTSCCNYNMPPKIYTRDTIYLSWGTMAKSPEYYSFMIIQL